MTNRAAARAEKEEVAVRDALIGQLRSDRDGLLDILNAIIAAAGGKIAVPMAVLQAASRRNIHVEHHLDRVVISVDETDEDKRPAIERLWLPH